MVKGKAHYLNVFFNLQSMYLNNDLRGSESKLPASSLSSRSVKDALAGHLVAPLVEKNCVAFAYRIVWRYTDARHEETWNDITLYRTRCDQALANFEGISFFISSISGVYTKPSVKGEAPKHVFPALAYWIITDHIHSIKQENLMHYLTQTCPGSLVKPLGNMAHPLVGQVELCNTLYMVVKDYSNGFVRKKIENSVNGAVDTGPTSRVVVRDCDNFKPLLESTIGACMAYKMTMALQEASMLTNQM